LFLLAILISPRFDWWRALPNWVHYLAFAALFAALWWTWPLPKYPVDTENTLFFFIGAYTGTILDHRAVPTQPKRPAWWICAVLGVLGVVGLFVLRGLLTAAFARMPVAPDASGGIVALTLGFYMTAIAPFLFRRVGVGREPPVHAEQGLVTEEPV
jgi:hypothetical protein